MDVYKDQILKRLEALGAVVVKGRPVGKISPTTASRASGEKQGLLLHLLENGKRPRIDTIKRAAEALGVSASALIDPSDDMGDFDRWPPPKWVKKLANRLTKRSDARRDARVKAAVEAGRNVGSCSECGKYDALVWKGDLCGACYQRFRRTRKAAEAASEATAPQR